MARDLKLSNWTWTAASGSGVMTIVNSTPTGDPTNTQGTITLNAGAVAGANVAAFRAASDAKNVAGFINSRMDSQSASPLGQHVVHEYVRTLCCFYWCSGYWRHSHMATGCWWIHCHGRSL